jgi:branched-chain amino acid transport system substrate-binding protein
VFILVASAFVGACTKSAPTAKTLKIGAIYSLTGEGSEAETCINGGAELAKEWLNEKGGVNIKGEKYLIELTTEDQKANPDGTVAAATKLVNQDNLKFIIGPCNPLMCMAETPVTEPAKVLRSISWGGGLPDVMSDKTPYTFRAVVCGAEAIPVNYTYLTNTYPNVKTVALISMDEPGGRFFTGVSQKEAEAHGLKVVTTEYYPWNTVDFYPVWTKILALKPDAVDAGMAYPEVSAAQLKQGRELGFTGPVLSAAPNDIYYIRDKVGADFAHDYFNGSLDLQSSNLPPMIKEIENRWAAKYKTPFIADTVFGWDSLWCLVQAIEKAQSLDPTEVAAAWEKMESIETSFGTGHMGGLKTYGINHLVVRQMPISKLENGEVKLVKWYTPEFP